MVDNNERKFECPKCGTVSTASEWDSNTVKIVGDLTDFTPFLLLESFDGCIYYCPCCSSGSHDYKIKEYEVTEFDEKKFVQDLNEFFQQRGVYVEVATNIYDEARMYIRNKHNNETVIRLASDEYTKLLKDSF